MVFYLPESTDGEPGLDHLTPRQIVVELDKYVVGQNEAKRAVAVALRNPHAAFEAASGNGGRGRAEEHHHDRPDRCR